MDVAHRETEESRVFRADAGVVVRRAGVSGFLAELAT